MSKFSDRLARAKADLGVSTRAAADRAKAQGYRLSANSVSLYTRDGHPDPDGKTVEALAYALRVPEAELRELAGLPQHHGKFEPAPEADTLTRQQRDAVNEVIRLFAAGNQGAGDGSERSATPMKQAGGKPAAKAGPTADELEELRRRQREADETPIDEILGLAADTGESEAERRARGEDSPE